MLDFVTLTSGLIQKSTIKQICNKECYQIILKVIKVLPYTKFDITEECNCLFNSLIIPIAKEEINEIKEVIGYNKILDACKELSNQFCEAK